MSKYNFNIDTIEDNSQIAKSRFQIKSQNDQYIESINFVDLELPSKTIWAKYNLGVDVELLDDCYNFWYGKHYAWGETYDKYDYNWTTYEHSEWKKINGLEIVMPTMKKYCYEKEFNGGVICENPDNKMELDLEDDAAHIELTNTKCCIPTVKQFEELLNNTIQKVEKDYLNIEHLCGIRFISKHNQNELFFPFSGYFNEDQLKRDTTQGIYWTRNLSDKYQSNACSFEIAKKAIKLGTYRRDQGCTIRSVLM